MKGPQTSQRVATFVVSYKRIALWGGLAYFWSLIDDIPVNADLLLGKGNYTMEVVLHTLTAFFFYLAIREATKGFGVPRATVLWMVLAFLASSADDAPFIGLIALLRDNYWYALDVVEHAVSLFLFYLAVRAPLSKRVELVE